MPRKSTKNAREAVIEAIARGCSKAEAGRLAGVARSTVDNILNEPGIPEAIDEFRRTVLVGAANKLAGAAQEAADKLRALLNEESPSIRLSAAKGILDTCCRVHELIVFDSRLQRLEESLKGTRTNGPSIVINGDFE